MGWNSRIKMLPSFPQGPAEILGRRFVDIAQRIAKRIGEFVDVRHAAVKAQLVDILGDMRERAVRRLAQD